MKQLELNKVNVGRHPDEVTYFEKAKCLHEGIITITNTDVTVVKKGETVLHTDIKLYESDSLSTTYKGCWKDNKSFRIVCLSESGQKLAKLMGKPEIIVFGSMYSDGYAVTFELLNYEESTNHMRGYNSYKEKAKELDVKLMGQFVVESMTNRITYITKSELSEMPVLALLQNQYARFCMQSKANITMDNVQKNNKTIVITALKDYMCKYASIVSNKDNPMMNCLYESNDICLVVQRISTLSLYSIYKDLDKLLPMPKQLLARSTDPEQVSTAISLYVYFTILTNKNFGESDYNRLFVESWFDFFYHWTTRLTQFQKEGIYWKEKFREVLLSD